MHPSPGRPPRALWGTVPGHLFIAQGDLRRLACDAWVVPTDAGGYVTAAWRSWTRPYAATLSRAGEQLERDRCLVLREASAGEPALVAVNSGAIGEGPEWYGRGLVAATLAAAGVCGTPRNHRKLPLVGVPL